MDKVGFITKGFQLFLRVFPQPVEEPFMDWDAETLLLAVDQFVWNQAPNCV